MSIERVMSVCTARGAQLDAVTRGSLPEWTAADTGTVLSGLSQPQTWALFYTYAGDDSVRGSLKWWLMECLLRERENAGWAGKCENVHGQRVKFSEQLVELFLYEERSPHAFRMAPILHAVWMEVEPSVWDRTLKHQFACVSSEYRRTLLDAEDRVKRKMRRAS